MGWRWFPKIAYQIEDGFQGLECETGNTILRVCFGLDTIKGGVKVVNPSPHLTH